jgi:hypothetical protein
MNACQRNWPPHCPPHAGVGTLASARQALIATLDLLEDHLDKITRGRITLTDEQREVLRQIRARQAALAVE